jgi:lipopolysaccharide transport system ATP-binding protein
MPAIKVENLSKVYKLGTLKSADKHLREAVTGLFKRARVDTHAGPVDDHILWALRDVSFEIEHGEVVGIIGRNGAGKSTILKILSRITDPSSGRAVLEGRVGSLLEVGTGFHPELSGRENVYLNGALLGMRRSVIERKFDEIIDFAGIERFLDTPVKRYSSGMYVRLAFAVAAHLEPDILIVDEVLAVGDVAFQNKCLGKMQSVANEGRTVLFVSHNMGVLQSLCRRGIVLKGGRCIYDGGIHDAIDSYMASVASSSGGGVLASPERRGDGSIKLTDVRILNDKGASVDRLIAGRAYTFELDYVCPSAPEALVFIAIISEKTATPLTVFSNREQVGVYRNLSNAGTFRCHIPDLPLMPGQYHLELALRHTNSTVSADWVPSALKFSVDSSEFFPNGLVPDDRYCSFMVEQQWEHVVQDSQSKAAG